MNLPSFKIRMFSTDQFFLDKTFYSNYYQIKGFKDTKNQPTIVDIGSTAGDFSFFAAILGAKKIYAFEINPDNYRLLLENTNQILDDKIVYYNVGIYTENTFLDFYKVPPQKGSPIYYDFSEIKLIEDYNSETEYYSMPVFTLDKILNNFCFNDNIDILKINLGFAELPILEQSSKLKTNVKNICLETSEDAARISIFASNMKNLGFSDIFQRTNEEDGKTLILLSQSKLKDYFLV